MLYKTALTDLLHTENWHINAMKCIQVKLTERGLERTKEKEREEGADYIPEDLI